MFINGQNFRAKFKNIGNSMNTPTQYEIDFLPVGDGEKSGDAIAMRYSDGSEWRVMVYDGGTKSSGAALVEHIRSHYGTSHVHYLVNSHPDQDHASGLLTVMENLTVGELWIHRPWLYVKDVIKHFEDDRITEESLANRFKEKMPHVWALEELAIKKDIPIYEPYQGSEIGCFKVLSPSKSWYLHTLLPEFGKTPEKVRIVEESLVSKAIDAIKKAIDFVKEEWGVESLREDVKTSADNESSAVLYANIDGCGVFFCGDSGVRALEHAADYADTQFMNLPEAKFYQVPHHGGRHNVSTSTLNRIVGEILDEGTKPKKTAFVSVAKDAGNHPKKVVTNAFIRRGANVVQTKGKIICSHHGTPAREGWTTAAKVDFSNEVETWN